jgi:hypothetical protein
MSILATACNLDRALAALCPGGLPEKKAAIRSSAPSSDGTTRKRNGDPMIQKTEGERPEAGRAKSQKSEPNITPLKTQGGETRYRVQIRVRADGKQFSFTKTFSALKTARKWRNRKLAEIELTARLRRGIPGAALA